VKLTSDNYARDGWAACALYLTAWAWIIWLLAG